MAHRVGIIGTGGIAVRHLEGYRLAGADVVAIAVFAVFAR